MPRLYVRWMLKFETVDSIIDGWSLDEYYKLKINLIALCGQWNITWVHVIGEV